MTTEIKFIVKDVSALLTINDGKEYDLRNTSRQNLEGGDSFILNTLGVLGINYFYDNGADDVSVRLDRKKIAKPSVGLSVSQTINGDEYVERIMRCDRLEYTTNNGIRVSVEPVKRRK